MGDLIPSLKRLDHRINETSPEPYPFDMPIYTTSSGKLTWTITTPQEYSLSGTLGAPVAALLGCTVSADIELALKKSIRRYSDIEFVDTTIIQPKRSYIDSILENADVSKWIKENRTLGAWRMYMVSGLIIARGSKSSETTESRGTLISGGPRIDMPAIAEAGLTLSSSTEKELSTSVENQSDFIWAVRLTKISKGVLDSTWMPETYTKGTTFGAEEAKINVDKTLATEEDFGQMDIIHTQGGGTFVLGSDSIAK